MQNKRIFIFEYVSGGGFNTHNIPSSLFSEGYGMLKSIIEDFKKLGLNVTTLLDNRIKYLARYLKADRIINVNSTDNFYDIFKISLQECSCCYIIAPEFSNILHNLTRIAEDFHVDVLSIGSDGIRLGSSKMNTYNFFKANDLTTPLTYLIPNKKNMLDPDFIISKLSEFGVPVIIKPDDGVGAESVYYLETETQVLNLCSKLELHSEIERKYILQEYVKGTDLSTSLVQSPKQKNLNLKILGINYQDIVSKETLKHLEYLGGYTPVENYAEIKKELETNLENVDFSSFNSFFGIDFIHTRSKKIVFIELNPRLTTSYLGVRKVININPVRFLFTENVNNFTSELVQPVGISKFLRLELFFKGSDSNQQISKIIIPELMLSIPEMISPPILSTTQDKYQHENPMYSCFIVTKTKTLKASEHRISEIISMLSQFGFELLYRNQ